MALVTLTFDNGPDPDITPRVLDVLDERGHAAWFCVVGDSLQRPGAPATTRDAIARGHRIANHTLTHGVPLGENPAPDHAATEIAAMDDLMGTVLGEWGPRWFRPFGRGGELGPHVFSPAAIAELGRLDYSVLLWNSVPRDWEDPRGWVDVALGDVASRAHTVVVVHDVIADAMAELPRFLDRLHDGGHTVTLDPAPDCVPMRDGAPTAALEPLTCR